MRYIALLFIFLTLTCSPQEPRKPRFEPWGIGMCAGYLGQKQAQILIHNQMVKYGLRSDTWIYKGVKTF